MPKEFKFPADFNLLHPEEQAKWRQKADENNQRLQRENLEDLMYGQKQESKMMGDINKERLDWSSKTPVDQGRIDEERRLADEFMAKREEKSDPEPLGIEDIKRQLREKRKENKKLKEKEYDEMSQEEKEKYELNEFMARQRKEKPTEEETPSSEYTCMNKVKDAPCEKPATTAFKHGGIFGDIPTITLCKDCSKLLNIMPIDELKKSDKEVASKGKSKEPQGESKYTDKQVKEIREKIRKDHKDYYETLGGKSGKESNMAIIFKKIAQLANKLDTNGLYDEADLLDKILKK